MDPKPGPQNGYSTLLLEFTRHPSPSARPEGLKWAKHQRLHLILLRRDLAGLDWAWRVLLCSETRWLNAFSTLRNISYIGIFCS